MLERDPEQRRLMEALLDCVGPLRLPFCPWTPTAVQEAFLRLPVFEALYAGAAGGGKSIALLMAACQFLDVPGYHALLLRPTLGEFDLPGGLMEMSFHFLSGRKAEWSGDQRAWRFPGPGRNGRGGASLRFGYLDGIKDTGHYAGSNFSFVGFDELVRFTEPSYRGMVRVLRQAAEAPDLPAAPDGTTLHDVPVRVRATSNPGGPGHAWVKSYFVDPATRAPGVIYLPSRLYDNPHVDADEYAVRLGRLAPSARERLLHGDWDIPDEGELFQRDWFQVIDRHELPDGLRAVRYWDLAAKPPTPANPDPDYTVGLRLETDHTTGSFYITDIVRARKGAGEVEELIQHTATRDGTRVEIRIEQEPGASGVALLDRFIRHVLPGYSVRAARPTGSKEIRAQPAAAAAQHGLIKIVRGPNMNDFLDEVAAFPHASHDDCVDALAGAHQAIAQRQPGLISWSYAVNRIGEPIQIRTRTARPPDTAKAHTPRKKKPRLQNVLTGIVYDDPEEPADTPPEELPYWMNDSWHEHTPNS